MKGRKSFNINGAAIIMCSSGCHSSELQVFIAKISSQLSQLSVAKHGARSGRVSRDVSLR